MEILREVLGEDLNRILISFPGVSFQGHGLHQLVSSQAGSHRSMQRVLMSAMALLFWFCYFSGPEAETQLRSRCVLFGSEPHCPGGLMLKGCSPTLLLIPPLKGSNLCD